MTKPIIHPIPSPAEFILLGCPELGGGCVVGLTLLNVVELLLRVHIDTGISEFISAVTLIISDMVIAKADVVIGFFTACVSDIILVWSVPVEVVTGVTGFKVKLGVEMKYKLALDIKSIAASVFSESEVLVFSVIIVSTVIWSKTPDIPEPILDSIDVWEKEFEVGSVMMVMVVIFGSTRWAPDPSTTCMYECNYINKHPLESSH